MQLRLYVDSISVKSGFFLPGGDLPDYPGTPQADLPEYDVVLFGMRDRSAHSGAGCRVTISGLSFKPDVKPGDVVTLDLAPSGETVSWSSGKYKDGTQWIGPMGSAARPVPKTAAPLDKGPKDVVE